MKKADAPPLTLTKAAHLPQALAAVKLTERRGMYLGHLTELAAGCWVQPCGPENNDQTLEVVIKR